MLQTCFKKGRRWLSKKCYFGGWRSQKKDRPGKTWKEVVDKDMNDLHTKPSDAMDRSKWRKMIRENRSDSSSDNDAESSIWIVRFWRRLTQVKLVLVCCSLLYALLKSSYCSCLKSEVKDRLQLHNNSVTIFQNLTVHSATCATTKLTMIYQWHLFLRHGVYKGIIST